MNVPIVDNIVLARKLEQVFLENRREVDDSRSLLTNLCEHDKTTVFAVSLHRSNNNKQPCSTMDMVHTIASEASSSDQQGVRKNRQVTIGNSLPVRTISRIGSDDLGIVFETVPETTDQADGPNEILAYVEPETRPVETIDDDEDDDDDNADDEEDVNSGGDVVEEDEESAYEYDDDDDYAGFLGSSAKIETILTDEVGNSQHSPARIRDEDEQHSSELPDVDADKKTTASAAASCAATITDGVKRWRQPSKAAVNMSHRAENEKSGGKRRLAQDLYHIMNQDTQEAGFSLHPEQEDSMDKWTINLFQFDEDSHLAKDMLVLGVDNIELSMSFPEQYPFEPPFVRVVKPRFKRQTGFVMNGALCMELLTKDGWNPVNDIESVIVSVRSLLPVGNGRLEAAVNLSEAKYESLLKAAQETKTSAKAIESATNDEDNLRCHKRRRKSVDGDDDVSNFDKDFDENSKEKQVSQRGEAGGAYSDSEAQAAYAHLSDYHKKKGWDTSGWWASKG